MTFFTFSKCGTPAVLSAVVAVFSLGLLAPITATAKAPKSRKAIVRAETVRLRSAPGKKGKLAGLLDSGRVARVLEKRDGWAKLKLESGTTGWVRADLLAINKKKTKDTGAFARQHPVAVATPPRRVRRTKPAPVVARHIPIHKAAKQVVAKRKPVMHPMARVAKPVPRVQPTAPRPVQIARALPRVMASPVAVATPRPVATPNAQIEAMTTEPFETATLREGVGSQALASVPTETPSVTIAAPTDAAPPVQTTPAVSMSVAPETIVASVPVPHSKPIKGGVAPAVRVPIERASKRGDRIVSRALTYRGTPYRMGATGRGAFDCSSFTRYILSQSGEQLPRTAAEQYRKGTPIDKADMRAGDLVFFKNTYKHGVSHVGIYMGDGKFVHASSHGGVKTSNLSDAYYVNHWAGARRPNITQGFE